MDQATVGISNSSVHSVIEHDDLLIEILIRLPVVSILDFKTVSKRWLSLIKNPSFTLRRSKTIVDPPSALVIKEYWSTKCDIFLLDTRSFPVVTTSFPPFCNKKEQNFQILHACNGLLLCGDSPTKYHYFVYNPIMNHFKSLPPCHDIAVRITGAKLAFDPAKSPHYKVISFLYNIYPNSSHSIQAYSSETGNWITCRRHPFKPFRQFGSGVYWNDAIYWSDIEHYKDRFFKLDVDSLNLSSIPLPEGILKDDEGTRTIDRQLFESRGCLLLSCRIRIDFSRDKWLIRVYEAKTDDDDDGALCFEWAVKYDIVEFDEVLMVAPVWARKHPYMWSVMCIVVGENEEDSFVVIRVRTQVIQYKIELKTLVMLRDLGPHHPLGSALFTCFPLVASFASV